MGFYRHFERVLTGALIDAGIDVWTPSRSQQAPHLMTVEQSSSPGRVWLRPHYTSTFEQIEIHIETAIAVVLAFANERADVLAWASEAEALELWRRLREAGGAVG